MSQENDVKEKKKVYIRTFGCQMNVYDTGKMKALLGKDGYEPTEHMADADLVIVNTCSIREKPELKVHSFLGEARKIKRTRQKDMTIAISGCVAQQEGQKLLDRYSDLDLVFGPDAVPNVQKLVQLSKSGKQVLDTDFLDQADYVFSAEIDPDAKKQVSAFVTIQKGCDNKCTFCIVPSTRGQEVSRPSAEIIQEVRSLVAKGVQEITLIGQNVNSYGLKTNEKTFAQLLYAVADVSGVERIRYTTSHPRDMGLDVVQAYRDLPQLCSQLHLPVQSGSSTVLRRMKRFYTRERYLEVVEQLREARPDIVFSTDFILGFPGETEEDFRQTMSLLEEVRFHSSFSFVYSPRPGTPALRLLDRTPVEAGVAKNRLIQLQALQQRISKEENRKLIGSAQLVLVEGGSPREKNLLFGRTGTFKGVHFEGDRSLLGQTVPVHIYQAFTSALRGELLGV